MPSPKPLTNSLAPQARPAGLVRCQSKAQPRLKKETVKPLARQRMISAACNTMLAGFGLLLYSGGRLWLG